ncbi:TatD DNase family protein [Tenacibaculum adriaticum]|uniref:TatD DNase family protein n=1 Tax=Tenacibaculum adriaticum TaxID=413713 RepID=A0A5S5DX70_9FLAO|nr:TatD family hydrolase [Tenacibaculum adriaticum]TYP99858.1 TatD DNase family protein [Tenacibaculum adriaticum]
MSENPFENINYLDFHTHKMRRQSEANISEIVSIHLGKETEHSLYTIGKHPWWTEEVLSKEELNTLTLHLSSEHCLAMGEMGLDKFKGPELSKQIEILKSQLVLANALKKPVIIHCVRAFDQLIQIKKEFPHIPNWCIHGFSRHPELAKQLIHQGFYISLIPVLQPTEKYKTLLTSLPLDRFFLETDSMPNISIENIYLQAAKILNISVETLIKQINKNAITFFNHE